MPDIAMCKVECDKSDECYRHMAIPDEYQCYASFDPKATVECYWPISEEEANYINYEEE